MPARGRAGADPALRHRARSTPGRLPARGPGHPGRGDHGPVDAQGALGRRLVQAAVAQAVARVRRTRRRGAARAARGDRGTARGVRQGRVGQAGVPAPDRPRATSAPGPVAAYLWHPQGQGPALPGRRTRALDGAGRDRPAARHHPRPVGPRLGADRRRQRDADEHGCPPRHARLPRPGRPEVRRPVARRGGTRAQAARHRAAPADHPHRRTAGSARVGRARPGRRGPPGHRDGC